MIDGEDLTCAFDAAGRAHRTGDALHRNIKDGRVCDARDLNVVKLAERPGRVVVWLLLRVARTPVLIIE